MYTDKLVKGGIIGLRATTILKSIDEFHVAARVSSGSHRAGDKVPADEWADIGFRLAYRKKFFHGFLSIAHRFPDTILHWHMEMKPWLNDEFYLHGAGIWSLSNNEDSEGFAIDMAFGFVHESGFGIRLGYLMGKAPIWWNRGWPLKTGPVNSVGYIRLEYWF